MDRLVKPLPSMTEIWVAAFTRCSVQLDDTTWRSRYDSYSFGQRIVKQFALAAGGKSCWTALGDYRVIARSISEGDLFK